jgi:hypothetical protein
MEEYPEEAIFAGESRLESTDAGAAIPKPGGIRLPMKTLIGYDLAK